MKFTKRSISPQLRKYIFRFTRENPSDTYVSPISWANGFVRKVICSRLGKDRRNSVKISSHTYKDDQFWGLLWPLNAELGLSDYKCHLVKEQSRQPIRKRALVKDRFWLAGLSGWRPLLCHQWIWRQKKYFITESANQVVSAQRGLC